MTPRQRIAWTLSVCLGAATLALFSVYWFAPSRIVRIDRPHSSWLAVALFVLLSLVVWHRIVMDLLNHVLSRRLPIRAVPGTGVAGFRVAFLTTFVPGSEPVSMLRTTLQAMLAAEYPHDTWVLDEGDDVAVKALCAELGVRHFSRKGVEHWNQREGQFAARTKVGTTTPGTRCTQTTMTSSRRSTPTSWSGRTSSRRPSPSSGTPTSPGS